MVVTPLCLYQYQCTAEAKELVVGKTLKWQIMAIHCCSKSLLKDVLLLITVNIYGVQESFYK